MVALGNVLRGGFWPDFDLAGVVVELSHMSRGNLLTQEPLIHNQTEYEPLHVGFFG
jgi:hypothetical protein